MSCSGRFFNPITDPNWDYAFPISVAGIEIGGSLGGNPPLMDISPICVCPGFLGIPAPGIGVTYWNPKYIAEIERSPMCFSSLGGLKLGDMFDMEASEQMATGSINVKEGSKGNVTRMQAHWYQYPLYALMEMFAEFCGNSSTGFNLAWLTEVDPTHQNDVWGAIYAPEAGLFSGLLANAACAADSTAAAVAWPLDPLFWCVGSWGPGYPMTGNAAVTNSPMAANGLVLAKFLEKQFRSGAMLATIGPGAKCSSHYSAVWFKTQLAINQIWPVRGNNVMSKVFPGKSEFTWGLNPPAHQPTNESGYYLLWNGQQCCLTLW
jgi:conjugal transfer pilus assembly protein TraU